MIGKNNDGLAISINNLEGPHRTSVLFISVLGEKATNP